MQAFAPLINLLVVLTILSVVAERITNAIKLRRPALRVRGESNEAERDREFSISLHSVGIGVIVALAVKANFFELVTHLEEPWTTFGWVNVEKYRWIRSPATTGFGPFAYTIVGCVLTGAALGFGSKFWHDVLGTVYDIRNRVRGRAPVGHEAATGDETSATSAGDS